jgi:hypothetical protein
VNDDETEAIRNSLFMTHEGFAKLLGSWPRPGRSPRGGMVTLLRLLEMFPGEKASLLVKLNKKVEAEKEKI